MTKKRLIFLGLGLMLITFIGLVVIGMVYNASDRIGVDSFFFQPNALSTQRVGVPESMSAMSKISLETKVVERIVSEYFYVIPSTNNVAYRTSENGPLKTNVDKAVWEKWLDSEAVKISEMADKKMLRTVRIIGTIPASDDNEFWTVNYELKTWERPNDLTVEPVVSFGTMYLLVETRSTGIRPKYADNARNEIKTHDPLILMNIGVNEIRF